TLGMPGPWNGRRVHLRRNITSPRSPSSEADAHSGTSNIPRTRIGNTNNSCCHAMDATVDTISPQELALPSLSKGRVGMVGLIIAESAIFTIFVVAYLFYLGKSLAGPSPQQVLELPLINTICLL